MGGGEKKSSIMMESKQANTKANRFFKGESTDVTLCSSCNTSETTSENNTQTTTQPLVHRTSSSEKLTVIRREGVSRRDAIGRGGRPYVLIGWSEWQSRHARGHGWKLAIG